ncbi:putative biotrophy-associated secreted protein 2 [Diaporthe ampelina]|uniref:Putative biotrophy-associated secreted protein 2 n=1 Tax=Diaporthe ampelina TaxID=1214573 RepID=A0A0G2F8Y5_9PEZI|nr:putative biotrophy-associated secreted protein 2 [Diaporthe ampelina]
MVRISAAAVLAFAVSALALAPNDAGAKSVGAGDGSQFTTGGCVNDADCQSACCAEISDSGLGICSAEAASTQNGKLGCGFVDPNADATIADAEAQVEEQGF